MFAVICPKCRTELQVPNSLAGCLIRCHECDGVTRTPRPEELEDRSGNPTFAVQTSQETPQHAREIQDFVKDAEDRARKEAEKVPYRRKRLPIDLICGIILVGGGLLLLLSALLGGGGGGLFGLLIFGILLPLILILLGAVCLLVWNST